MGYPRRVFSKEQVQRVIEQYSAGVSASEIARQMVCCQPTIRKLLIQNGVESHPSHAFSRRTFRPADEARIADLYRAGKSSLWICREFKCDKSTVIDALRRAGVVLRNKGKARLAEIDSRRTEIVERYHAGESVWALKQAFGCASVNSIRRVLREAGIAHPEHRLCVGPRHHAWKGGQHLDHAGYLRTKLRKSDPLYSMCAKNGYVMTHRLVMAKKLGRPLLKTETVHHINGDRKDNRPDNLQLWQGKHGAGVYYVCRECGSHNIEAVQIKSGE